MNPVADPAAPTVPAAPVPTVPMVAAGYDLGSAGDRGDVVPVDQRFGSQYVLGEQLGRGAMGRVVRARRLDGGPDVAVKLLRDDVTGDTAVMSRFLTEKRVLESLRHEHVVRVLDLVVDGGRVGIVMELVEGGDLRRLMTGPLPEEQVRVLGGQLARGLACAHDIDVVHRDLKPENVLVVDRPPHLHVKLSDFGVSRLLGSAVTAVSSVVGTPTYMAPECSDGTGAGPASDVYALGVLLYEAVCGRAPFTAESVTALILAHAGAAPVRPPWASDELWSLLGRMLEKAPANRPTAEQVAQILGDGRDLPRVELLPPPPNRSETTLVPQADPGAGVPDAATVLRPAAPAAPPPAPERSRRGRRAAAAAAVLLAVAVGAVWAAGLLPGFPAGLLPGQGTDGAVPVAATGTSTSAPALSPATGPAPSTAPTPSSGRPTANGTSGPAGVPVSTVTVTTAAKPAGSSTRRTSTSRPPAAVVPTGSIALSGGPGGARVRQCEYFAGRATLPRGTTLAVTMHNLDNGRPETFLELVAGYENPASLRSWRGHQYFGAGDSSVGQRFRVELVAVPLADARAADEAAGLAGNDQPLHDLAAKGRTLASLTVLRIAGPGTPADCSLF